MKFISVLLAAVNLLGIANAIANIHTDASDVIVAASAVQERAPDPADCDKYCHQPWLKCYDKCGGGDDCSHYCNCVLFRNPHLFCRHAHCVEDPGACHSTKISPVAGRAEDAEVIDVKASPVDGNDPFIKSIGDIEARVPNPCVVCQTAINSCKRKCTDDACKDACNCYQKQYNANCKECSISCNSLKERRNESIQAVDGDVPIGSAHVALPVPISPCVTCLFSVNSCKKQCHTKGACDDACNCYHKNSISCKECKLPCHCVHSYLRLAPAQRRAGIEIETANDSEPAERETETYDEEGAY